MQFHKSILIIVGLTALLDLVAGLAQPSPSTSVTSSSSASTSASTSRSGLMSRRNLFGLGLSSAVLFGITGEEDVALAFSNKISDKYDDRPKRKGPQPKDLGVSTRMDMIGDEYMGLKHCGNAPNCFCSTENPEDDPDHFIPSWSWPKDMDKAQAFQQLEGVIQTYEPGQDGIDGGGFDIVKSDPKTGYFYIQFQALKNGYIDDFEVAYITIDGGGDRAVQVRSSSRVGYLDYGVNAKRINYIAKNLREKGWDAPGVDFATHNNYAVQNAAG